MTTERLKCAVCDKMILPATAYAHHGLCAQCVKLSPEELVVALAVKGGLNPLHHAINLYDSLIDGLAKDSPDTYFGGIGDPLFEGIRFYRFETLSGCFDYDNAVERGSETVDEIELYLSAAATGYSLLFPVLTKVKSVAATFNSKGKTVFLGSWGMAPGEIGWMIRHLNDRPAFDRYLREAGITEEEVDVYNDAYARELHAAKQATEYVPIRHGS